MASIPGPVILIAGAAVSGISFFLNKKSIALNGPYALFLYLGVVILFYGFVKTIVWYMTRTSPEEIKQEVKQDIAQKEKQRLQNQESAFDKAQKEDFDEDRYKVVLRCRNCNMPHFIYNNYCSNCGMKLIK